MVNSVITLRGTKPLRYAATVAVFVTTFLTCFYFESINDRYYDRDHYINSSPLVQRSLLATDDPTKKRLALVRPFGPRDVKALLHSFDLWATKWPCVPPQNQVYDVELVLSYSRRVGENGSRQTFDNDDDALAARAVDEIRVKMLGERNSGWGECFTGLRVIEAGLDERSDHYSKDGTGLPSRMDWVEGPNGQFRENMAQLMALSGMNGDEDKRYYYELVMVMEADNLPQRTGWLNEVLDEIQANTPFALLGSKYKGHSWDGFKDVMAPSLLNHINGNAIYNITHPLFQRYHKELKKEAGTKFAAVPYDYRISQMVHEGRYGTQPEFPFPWMRHHLSGKRIELHKKPQLVTYWKNHGGADLDEQDAAYPIKESDVLANFGEGNFLQEHVGNAALVHGMNVYRPHNPNTHQISLVVTSWDNHIHRNNLLHDLNEKNHKHKQIFEEVVVMQNTFVPTSGAPSEGVPYRFVDRLNTDITDVCDAPVSTEWFYHTNSYHNVADEVDLLFSRDETVSRPVVSYTPAESIHCNAYKACRETIRIAREIYPDLDKVVLDMDLPYHVPSRNAFCNFWKAKYGMNGEHLALQEGGRGLALANSTPIVPTATAYVAFLYRNGLAEHLYHFSNTLRHGSKKLFVRAVEDKYTGTLVSFLQKQLDEDAASSDNEHERRLKGKPPRDPPPPPSPSPPPPSPSPPTTDQCASSGEVCKGKGSLPCCSLFTCGSEKKCIDASGYGGGSSRMLRFSEPGFLVDD